MAYQAFRKCFSKSIYIANIFLRKSVPICNKTKLLFPWFTVRVQELSIAGLSLIIVKSKQCKNQLGVQIELPY